MTNSQLQQSKGIPMKSLSFLGALLLAFSSAATAQGADVPRHKCDPKPTMPGPRMMEDSSVVKRFQRDIEAYKACMKAYADERALASKAHTDAGNAAIDEYNATMKALQDLQKR
jgi:hypothetical protein